MKKLGRLNYTTLIRNNMIKEFKQMHVSNTRQRTKLNKANHINSLLSTSKYNFTNKQNPTKSQSSLMTHISKIALIDYFNPKSTDTPQSVRTIKRIPSSFLFLYIGTFAPLVFSSSYILFTGFVGGGITKSVFFYIKYLNIINALNLGIKVGSLTEEISDDLAFKEPLDLTDLRTPAKAFACSFALSQILLNVKLNPIVWAVVFLGLVSNSCTMNKELYKVYLKYSSGNNKITWNLEYYYLLARSLIIMSIIVLVFAMLNFRDILLYVDRPNSLSRARELFKLRDREYRKVINEAEKNLGLGVLAD